MDTCVVIGKSIDHLLLNLEFGERDHESHVPSTFPVIPKLLIGLDAVFILENELFVSSCRATIFLPTQL